VAGTSNPARVRNGVVKGVLTRSSRGRVITAGSHAAAFHAADHALDGCSHASLHSHAELLSIGGVEVHTKMKRSNIYRLIKLGLFPAPIHMGGSKWDAAEIEEYILRLKEERDRKFGPNKFVPRPGIQSGQDADGLNGSLPDHRLGASVGLPPSTLRVLGPELCSALKMLKVDIPELYLDSASWNVSLAVMKVELSPVGNTNGMIKAKKC
jgi:predicted DNA-binding transcriptional regulator AlpA